MDENRKKQLSVAGQLVDALSFLRSTARTNDYFTGYSLNEIIQERIELIGEEEDSVDAKVGDSQKLTLMAGLNSLLLAVVGEAPKYDGGAIGDALSLESIEDVKENEEMESYTE